MKLAVIYVGNKTRVKFVGSGLKFHLNKITFTHETIVNIYIMI